MVHQPIPLSRRQIKAMDRVGGAMLMLPWPEGLPPGRAVALEDGRETTPAEHAAAVAIVQEACDAHGLVPVRSVATMMRPMERNERMGEQYLGVLIVGRRWVNANLRYEAWATDWPDKRPPLLWSDAEARPSPISPEPKSAPWTGADLRAWRDRMKLSQSAAAAEIGVSVDAIQDYEQGRSRVPAYVPRLCRYYERFGAL
jgi:hypothetical protein